MTTERTSVQSELTALEERLRLAELGPDPAFFQSTLADDAVVVQNGDLALTKRQVVDGHQPRAVRSS